MQLRIANALNSLCLVYLGKTLLPVGLTPLYPLMQDLRLVWDLFLLPALIFVGVSIACYRAWRRGWMIFAMAWLYYIITLSPVIGIVQVGSQAAADRYTYFPSLAFSVLVASGLYLWLTRAIRYFECACSRLQNFALPGIGDVQHFNGSPDRGLGRLVELMVGGGEALSASRRARHGGTVLGSAGERQG